MNGDATMTATSLSPRRVLKVLWIPLTLFVIAACSDAPGTLLFSFEVLPPDTTTVDSIAIGGRVVRSPPLADARFTVIVTGGRDTVEQAANEFGLFTVWVMLNRLTENSLVVRARDNTGAQAEPRRFTVVHIEEIQSVAPATPDE